MWWSPRSATTNCPRVGVVHASHHPGVASRGAGDLSQSAAVAAFRRATTRIEPEPRGTAPVRRELDARAPPAIPLRAVDFQPQTRRVPAIRLFRSDFLESLTRVQPWLVVVVWSPIIVWFLLDAWTSRAATGMTTGALLAAHVFGLLAWTLVEHTLHRFVFHFAPRNPPAWLHRLLFLAHGIHHVQPWDKSRLLMPPGVSLPMALLFYWLFAWGVDCCASPAWLSPIFGAFLAGYLGYDLLHYATHHLPMTGMVGRRLKRHHLLHHYVTPDMRFGVSSPLWDLLLRTLPHGAAKAHDEEEADQRLGLG